MLGPLPSHYRAPRIFPSKETSTWNVTRHGLLRPNRIEAQKDRGFRKLTKNDSHDNIVFLSTES